MTKSELINKVASDVGISNSQAESAISALFSTIVDSAKGGEKVAWPGFGTFTVKERAARTGRNPATGATINIAASKVMHFGASSGLKSTLNG